MRMRTTSHSGPHVLHLLQCVLLLLLAIVTESGEVSLHANQATGTSNVIMRSPRCRIGDELGCSVPIYIPDALSLRSRKELLLCPPRSLKGQPEQLSPSRHTDSPTTFLNSRQVTTSETVTQSYRNHGLHSVSKSLPIMSSMQLSRSRPQGGGPSVEQILSQSNLRSPSSPSSPQHPDPRDTSFLKGASHLPLNQDDDPWEATAGKHYRQLPNQDDDSTETIARKHCRQLLRMRQSVSMSNFHGLPTQKGRLQPEIRRLAGVVSRRGHDNQLGKSLQLYENSAVIIPIETDRPNINVSNFVGHWKAPPMESGPLMTITVSQCGAADFSSIQEAVDSVCPRNTQRIMIRIHAGTYREKVIVPYNKPFITFHGDEHGGTVVSWNATASSPDYNFGKTKDESSSYKSKFGRMVNGSSVLFGTMHSATATILADGFVAQHIVFQNSAPPPEPGAVGAQAVAFLVSGDRAAFYNCSFLGAQDTLYDYTGRHYYLNCYIEGSIDFIFGNGRSLFEGCHLHSIAKSFGAIAAHQRLSPVDDTGFSFDRCSVTGSGTLYLGRAWSPYARIVFARTYFDNIISAEGWSDFGDPHRQSTTFFGQYQCTGPGANLSRRAPWAKVLTDNDVLPYLGLNFVNGKQWLGTWPVEAQRKNGTAP